MKIGIDIMGGDFAPDTTVAGAILAQKELDSEAQIVLIGKEDEIRSRISKNLLIKSFSTNQYVRVAYLRFLSKLLMRVAKLHKGPWPDPAWVKGTGSDYTLCLEICRYLRVEELIINRVIAPS